MTHTQVILAGGSRFVQDMLYRVIRKTPGLQVAGQVTDLQRLPSAVERTQAAWIILSYSGEQNLPPVVDRVLVNYPSLRVLTVSLDGSRVRLRRVESHEEELPHVTLDDLIAILRSNGSKPMRQEES